MKFVKKPLLVLFLMFFFLSPGFASTDLVDNLSQLVRFKTVDGQQDEIKQAYDWIKKQLDGLPVYFKEETSQGYTSLLITTQNTKTPKLWLVSHIDVVAGSDDLFEPKIKNNQLIGRGVLDNKFSLAVFIDLFKSLGDDLKQYDMGIMITADEEIGGFNGVQYLLDTGYGSEIAFIPDGGFNWQYELKAKGFIAIDVLVKGKSAHGSRPWLGDSAIYKLINVIKEIDDYFKVLKQEHPVYFPTVNVGKIEGGTAVNQVPATAKASIDIRYPPSFKPEVIQQKLNKIVDSYDGDVTLNVIYTGNPNFSDINHPASQALLKTAAGLGVETGTTRAYGATDARYFYARGIHTIIINPKGGDIHSENEWIDIKDLKRFNQIIYDWITQGTIAKHNENG